jgi:hypothetical protein
LGCRSSAISAWSWPYCPWKLCSALARASSIDVDWFCTLGIWHWELVTGGYVFSHIYLWISIGRQAGIESRVLQDIHWSRVIEEGANIRKSGLVNSY